MTKEEELEMKIRELAAELHKLERQFKVGEDSFWKADLDTRKSFAALRLSMEEMRRDIKVELSFFDTKFTNLFNGVEARFESLQRGIAETIVELFAEEREKSREMMREEFKKMRSEIKTEIGDEFTKMRSEIREAIAEAFAANRAQENSDDSNK